MATRVTPVRYSRRITPVRRFWGLRFDGVDDYATIPTSDDFLFGTGSFTVEVWACWRDGAQVNERVISTGYCKWEIVVRSIYWAASLGDDASHILDYDALRDPSPAAKDVWTHLALVVDRDAETARLVKNGTTVVTKSIAGWGNINWPINIRIGDLPTGNSNAKVDVAAVRIWKGVALSNAQLQASMYNPWATGPGLVAGYVMRSGRGQTVEDVLGEHDGTLGSTPGADTNDPVWIGPYSYMTPSGPHE